MRAFARRIAGSAMRRSGWTLQRRIPSDVEPAFLEIWRRASPYSMTSLERMYGLWKAALHVTSAAVEGAIVECGVWRGGSMMACAATLRAAGVTDRELWLYDTFAGMPKPGERDVSHGGAPAQLRWTQDGSADASDWARAGLDEVKRNVTSTGYPPDRMHWIVGKVEDTIPATVPGPIALLRLDTDWYTSTLHELEHLYPLLQPGGVLIVDDYGHWKGARQAVDEYFAQVAHPPLLGRLDYTGRMGIKPQ